MTQTIRPDAGSFAELFVGLARELASNSDSDSAELAARCVAKLRVSDMRRLATAELQRWVDAVRREEAQRVERAASAVATAATPTVEHPAWEASLSDPVGSPLPFLNSRERKGFRRFAGARFESWRSTVEAHLSGDEDALDTFHADWHPEGVMAYVHEKRLERVHEYVDAVAAATELRVTRELLETFFALGDGIRVTWGSATIEQHEQRIAMLERNALGVIETAARHRAAVRVLRDSGRRSLAELAAA